MSFVACGRCCSGKRWFWIVAMAARHACVQALTGWSWRCRDRTRLVVLAVRDGLRISCTASGPALRALCASTGSHAPTALLAPASTGTSTVRGISGAATGSTWRSSPYATARPTLGE